MKTSDRDYNSLINSCLVVALLASLAPQYFSSVQPWSGYVALAAGLVALFAYFFVEHKAEVDKDCKDLERQHATQIPNLQRPATEIHRLQNDWARLIAEGPLRQLETHAKPLRRKMPETERLREQFLIEGPLEITIGLMTVRIEAESHTVRIISSTKAGSKISIDAPSGTPQTVLPAKRQVYN